VADKPGDGLDRRLDELAGLLERLSPDDPAVVQSLLRASHLLLALGTSRSVLANDRVRTSYERLAERWPTDHPMAAYVVFLSRSVRYAQALFAGDTERADITLVEMISSASLVPAGHPLLPLVLCGVAMAHIERHSLGGDLRNLDLAADAINGALAAAARLGGLFAAGTALHGFLLYVRGHVNMVWNVYDPRLPRVVAAIEDLEQALAQVGPELATDVDLTSVLSSARVMHEQLIAPSGPGRPLGAKTDTAFTQLLETAAAMGPDRTDFPTVAVQAASGLALRALSSGDVTLLEQAIAQLSDVRKIPGLGLRERPKLLHLYGYALQTRYHMIRDPRDLSNAISVLEDARRAVEQELASPYASDVLLALADAYRTRANEALGDTDRAVRIGLAGLREHAGDVLLQDSDENALHMARHGSDDATEMTRWFLARGRHEAAISAIELGRGMVLHAATSGSSVAEALVAAGHPALAAAWAARTGGPVLEHGGADDDLRYRAMRALEGTSAEAALLSPPALDDIAEALVRTGTDLLGYLLPQQWSGAGMATGLAVLVDWRGVVRWIPLPRLRVGNGSVVDEFVRARRAAETTSAEALVALRTRWRETLNEVCDWAWEAVIGPVLKAASGQGHAGRTVAEPPRVVLIPIGQLGLIPWHAARWREGGSLPRYACQDVTFSYASSARQFVEASRRRPRPWPQAAVLISDNDRSLPDATLEVAHLYAAYYRGGTVYGSARADLPAEVPGTTSAGPADVLAALPHGSFPGASLLHFGCHGQVAVPVLEASLRLGPPVEGGGKGAGDDEAVQEREIGVSVRDILRQARAAPPSAGNASGGLVILAACLTDVTESDYDEALTLATAFIAAGSTGVVAARWAVQDAPTTLFMAMFHGFLNAGNADPAHALRQAQLWMLDPAREIPAAWPEPLRQKAARLMTFRAGSSLSGVESWAAFTYQGR
jgi:CHAT domain